MIEVIERIRREKAGAVTHDGIYSVFVHDLDVVFQHVADQDMKIEGLQNALRLAIQQNSLGMLLTSDEVRACEASLGETDPSEAKVRT